MRRKDYAIAAAVVLAALGVWFGITQIQINAVVAKLNQTKDPYARNEAFTSLIGKAGWRGVGAERAARDTRRTVPSFAAMMRLGSVGTAPGSHVETTRLVATQRDAKRVLWGLFVSPLIGSNRDMWIARHDDRHWVEPVFTGETVPRSALTKEWREGDRDLVFRMDDELIGKGGWFGRFVGNPELRRDSDDDGLTDLVEKRLGTNPYAADTDGDGLKDGEDKNPLAGPRVLTDEEQVLRGAFEGRFRFLPGYGTCVVFLPRRMRAMEFAGWEGLIVCRHEGDFSKKHPMPHSGEGAAEIDFLQPEYDFSLRNNQRVTADDPVLWNSGHTMAKVRVRTWYGALNMTGYDMTLRKFGDDWLVTESLLVIQS